MREEVDGGGWRKWMCKARLKQADEGGGGGREEKEKEEEGEEDEDEAEEGEGGYKKIPRQE